MYFFSGLDINIEPGSCSEFFFFFIVLRVNII